MATIRLEEYSTLGDFVKASFVRDQGEFLVRFPKLDSHFLANFESKLQGIKTLESALVLTEEQKTATAQLYAEAGVMNKELNFLSAYIRDAGLSSVAVSELKTDLRTGNIEGALLKMEGVKQYVVAHQAALEAEGMAADFPVVIEAHKTSMEQKNALQNSYMNARKQLTQENKQQYKELYVFINKIVKAGKLLYDGETKKDEYTLSKVIGRMRVAPNATGGVTP